MPVIQECEHPGCSSLTIGPLCIEHDHLAVARTVNGDGGARRAAAARNGGHAAAQLGGGEQNGSGDSRVALLERGETTVEPETAVFDVAIVGAGYVGLPLARTFSEAGRSVVLVDVDAERVACLGRGESHVEDVPSPVLRELIEQRGLAATTDYDVLRDAAAVVIALPTPLTRQREPDLSIVRSAAAEIAPRLRAGHLVVLESTTYPGTTRTVVQPILEAGSGMRAGTDFHLAFSPERIDPGRTDHTTQTVPKVVGGIDEASTEAAARLYESALDTIHRVSSTEAAELTKLLENIFRSVNIALVNELAQLCERMEIDVW